MEIDNLRSIRVILEGILRVHNTKIVSLLNMAFCSCIYMWALLSSIGIKPIQLQHRAA